MSDDSLAIEYGDHRPVQYLIDCLQFGLEGISAEFQKYDEQFVKGPGLYFAVVSGCSVDEYADPMGDNRWPVENYREVTADLDTFTDVAYDVATSCDGAVVVSVDGVIADQMVRFKDVGVEGAPDYADWMGSRHMSAYDISTRQDVVATITLSEETGRVTRFQSGSYTSLERDELGTPWRGKG